MTALTPLQDCLDQALDGLAPVEAAPLAPRAAVGHVLAQDARLPGDSPAGHEALRAGVAVAALDLVGASAQMPLSLRQAPRVAPGMPLPPGTDAVLPDEGTDRLGPGVAAIRAIDPGEGVRRAGHDGRAGDLLLPAGRQVRLAQAWAAELAGIDQLWVRRPRCRVALPDPAQAQYVAHWARALGAICAEDAPDLILRPVPDHCPRLALAPAETAWIAGPGTGSGSVLEVWLPARFDAMVAALLALALPALAALAGGQLRLCTRPVMRKLPSRVGMAELVLLQEEASAWAPAPVGLITLSGLARAEAFAILPAAGEGLAAGGILSATSFDNPLG